MTTAEQQLTSTDTAKATVWIFLTLAGVACAMTSLYLGMRMVMEIGGACASGNTPFEPTRPCPQGTGLLVGASIPIGLVLMGGYVLGTSRYRIPSFALLAWPALFLSLGWNFLEFGLNPPGGGGPAWGWLVCAILFMLMGGLPLLGFVKPTIQAFKGDGGPDPGPNEPLAGRSHGVKWYWLVVQLAAVATGIYAGVELAAAVSS